MNTYNSEDIAKVKKSDLEELIDRRVREKISEEISQRSNDNSCDSVLSRRQFLKVLGAGIGVLSLSSLTSAWSILQPSNQGTSDIDAAKVDGKNANDLGKSREEIQEMSLIWSEGFAPGFGGS
ncbi:MAG: hypothetical protein ACI8Z7_000420 [Candidatus Nanohaloarchaea archaeon]|jgi:hypothetical protein